MAHEQLVGSSQGLREQGRACPTELMRTLMLLHSYILVKTLVRMGDHPVSPSSHSCQATVACQSGLHIDTWLRLIVLVIGSWLLIFCIGTKHM